jgi:hypothetical protein
LYSAITAGKPCAQRRYGHATLAARDEVAHVGKGRIQVRQQRARHVHEHQSFGCQVDVTRVARDQLRAHGCFQLLDDGAEGRLRQVAALGRPREVAGVVERQVRLQLFRGEVRRHRLICKTA